VEKNTIAPNTLVTLSRSKPELPADFSAGCLILVNKPLEWTSFDVVNRIKYAIKHNHGLPGIKVGHAGTLDPMADGLLIVCTGKYTKLLEGLSSDHKSYQAQIKLGVTTASFDRESEEINATDIAHLTSDQIAEVISGFSGWIDQVPPIFSAVKIKGKNAYTLARRGADIELKSRRVEIRKYAVTDVSLPFVSFDVEVSKGTYIRSLANDIGKELGVGAYLYGLTRTTIGDFSLENALSIEEVVSIIKREHPGD